MKHAFAQVAAAALLSVIAINPAFAVASNNPPPSGPPVILDLNGQHIPTVYTQYTASFVATTTTTALSFALRDDPAFLSLSNVSLTTGGSANLLINGNFGAGPVGASAPQGWTYLNTFGAAFGGTVAGGNSGFGGSANSYFDGAVQAYDAITQAITTVVGQTYDLSFYLKENNGRIQTFSRVSTNGNTTNTGGNGIDLIVYAGSTTPVLNLDAAPGPIPGAGLLSYIALGLLGLGSYGWKRLRPAV